MPRPTRDLTGQVFGRLTAWKRAVGTSRVSWVCFCKCGNEVTVLADAILSGRTRSCGCLRVETTIARSTTHGATKGTTRGGSRKRTYRVWVGMLQRCRNEKNPKYQSYGARGAIVCERWLSYENFLADMGAAPAGLSIERVNTNGNYEPSNCEWADQKAQQNNRRNNRRVVVNGTCIFNIGEVEELVGLNRHTIARRIAAGAPIVTDIGVFNIVEYAGRG